MICPLLITCLYTSVGGNGWEKVRGDMRGRYRGVDPVYPLGLERIIAIHDTELATH